MSGVYPLTPVGTVILLGCALVAFRCIFCWFGGEPLGRRTKVVAFLLMAFAMATHAAGYGWPA